MAKRDYYEVLGIERSAELPQVKVAYRKLAIQFHPDRNPGDAEAEESFKEAAEAYAVLSDPDKRARYDRFGHGAFSAGGGAGGGFDPSVFGDFSDILGDLFGFGGRGGRSGPAIGADLRYDLRITFEEAAFGVDPTLRIPRLESCGSCRGSGSQGGKPPSACAACAGRGQIRFSQGFFTVARTCPRCAGSGQTISDPCLECHGEGRVETERSIRVKVPPGVDTGARLRLSGEGEHGVRGGPPGDLYVVIHMGEHERFARHGADVLSREIIAVPQAVLGAPIEVTTLHGTESLEVPPGTAHGSQFRLRGQGFPRLGRSGRGDHIVEVAIVIPDPRQLSEEELGLVRRWAELRGQSVREGGFLDRVKDLFA